MSEKELREAIKPLIDGGFFSDDIGNFTLAGCKRDASPEKE